MTSPESEESSVQIDSIREVYGGQINVAGRDLRQNIVNFFSSDGGPLRTLRNRQAMLQLVENTWIEGVLKRSLRNEVRIELGLQSQPEEIEHPWDRIIQLPDQALQVIPTGSSMIQVFDLASSALLILGQPGAGKTTLLLELACEAIQRAEQDITQPIPVVFNLSSWSPKQSIEEWLVEELRGKYYISKKISQPWVKNDDLMLLLDGLDEVKPEFRERCVQALNRFREIHSVPLVVCSRALEYQALANQLKLRGAVLIQPLSIRQIEEYLDKVGAGSKSIYQMIAQDEELKDLLQTPLMLNILILAYQCIPFEELKALPTAQARRKLLFDAYIQQMVSRRKPTSRYPAEQTNNWLAWLAREMIERDQLIFFIENLQTSWLQDVSQVRRQNFLIDLLRGSVYGLFAGAIFGILQGWNGVLIAGLLAGLYGGLRRRLKMKIGWPGGEPLRQSWSWKNTLPELLVGLILGLTEGLALLLIEGPSPTLLYIAGYKITAPNLLLNAPLAMLLFGLLIGIGSCIPSLQISEELQPVEKIHWSWVKALRGLLLGLVIEISSVILFELIFGLLSIAFEKNTQRIEYLSFVGALFLIASSFILLPFLGMLFGLQGAVIETRGQPGEGIRTSLKNALRFGLFLGVLFGTLFGLLQRLLEAVWVPMILGVALCGFLFGFLIFGGIFTIAHYSLRRSLSQVGCLPWNLFEFLDYSVDRIFLRRVGGGYVFIHRMMMEHFAGMVAVPEPELHHLKG